jgi:hypothetical protein
MIAETPSMISFFSSSSWRVLKWLLSAIGVKTKLPQQDPAERRGQRQRNRAQDDRGVPDPGQHRHEADDAAGHAECRRPFRRNPAPSPVVVSAGQPGT